jgi:hypothetical protein
LVQRRLLDRLISGRIWIGVIAFALIGIVTMQLGLLKLNAGIGRALEHEALLQRENATLSAENSELAAGYRVEPQAVLVGMQLIPSGALHFLSARPSLDASRGAAALGTPVATAAGATATSAGSTGSLVAEGPPGAATGVATSPSASVEAPSGTSGSTSATPTSSNGSSALPASSATTTERRSTGSTSEAAAGGGSATGPSGGAGEAAARSSAPTGGGEAAPSG